MPMKSASELTKIHTINQGELEKWRHLYRDAYRYMDAARDIIDRPQQGNRRHDVIFDSTAPRSKERLANRLQDLLFPQGKHFVEPKPGPALDNENEEAKVAVAKQLQEINERWHSAIWGSNFSTVINEVMGDMVIGTGAMLFNEGPDWNPFHFTAVPQYQCAFGQAAWGTIGEVSREVKLHPRVAKQQWPDSRPLSDAEKKSSAEGDEKAFIEITYPDEGAMVNGGAVGSIPTKWFYAVIERDTGRMFLRRQRVIETASHWITPRWTRSPNEVRGRGPGLAVMPDVRTVNKVVELILKNASLAVSGLWTVRDDGVFNPNTTSFRAGSMIVVRDNDGPRGPSIAPLENPGNFDISQLVLQDLRSQIKNQLFDADLPPITAAVRTATEFIQRLRELFVDIGPAGGRVMAELMQPIYLRGLHILRKKGLIEIPENLQLNNQFIALQVVSPLAQREALDNIEKVMRALELSSFLGQEVVALNYKIEEIPRWIGEQLGVLEDLMREPADKKQLQDTVVQLITQTQQLAGQQPGQSGGPVNAQTAPAVAAAA